MTPETLTELLHNALDIVRSTAAFIAEEAHNFTAKDIETKSKNSLVSYVDKTAEKQLVEQLGALLPEAGFMAEEGTSSKVGEVYNWIIDPLDGTTNFMHGIPVYSVSVGLQQNDEMILGIVHEINQNESFYAAKGQGAFLNGEPIYCSSETNVSNSLVATGFPYYDYAQLDGYMKALSHFMHNSRGVRRLGSAAVDLAYVACGRFEAFFEYGLHAWDVAAGGFIVQEAGGITVDFKGGKDWVFGKSIVATCGDIAVPFQENIRSFFGEE